jgi:hypothetical protein
VLNNREPARDQPALKKCEMSTWKFDSAHTSIGFDFGLKYLPTRPLIENRTRHDA